MINWKDDIVPEAPYYANVFHYYLSDDLDGYEEMDEVTMDQVMQVDGFLGWESHRSENRGSFVSYWRDKEAIDQWRKNTVHTKAKSEGIRRWYKYYHSMVVKVESANFHSLS